MSPIYEYLCINGHRHERLEPMGGDGEADGSIWVRGASGGYWRSVRDCPECGGEAFRQMAAPALPHDGAYSYDQGKKEGAA